LFFSWSVHTLKVGYNSPQVQASPTIWPSARGRPLSQSVYSFVVGYGGGEVHTEDCGAGGDLVGKAVCKNAWVAFPKNVKKTDPSS